MSFGKRKPDPPPPTIRRGRGEKIGGNKYKADDPVDQGPLTCTTCQGSGNVERRHAELGDGELYDSADIQDCPDCDGDGKVKR